MDWTAGGARAAAPAENQGGPSIRKEPGNARASHRALGGPMRPPGRDEPALAPAVSAERCPCLPAGGLNAAGGSPTTLRGPSAQHPIAMA
eukprot:2106738-Alexandrium_andersonii.AAC.1